jgi:hypothetical protein
VERRRRWSAEEKQAIVVESVEPNVSIAPIARKHGIGTGQLYGWRHQYLTSHPGQATGFARVELVGKLPCLSGPIAPSSRICFRSSGLARSACHSRDSLRANSEFAVILGAGLWRHFRRRAGRLWISLPHLPAEVRHARS